MGASRNAIFSCQNIQHLVVFTFPTFGGFLVLLQCRPRIFSNNAFQGFYNFLQKVGNGRHRHRRHRHHHHHHHHHHQAPQSQPVVAPSSGTATPTEISSCSASCAATPKSERKKPLGDSTNRRLTHVKQKIRSMAWQQDALPFKFRDALHFKNRPFAPRRKSSVVFQLRLGQNSSIGQWLPCSLRRKGQSC